jgi:hypothetical protein
VAPRGQVAAEGVTPSRMVGVDRGSGRRQEHGVSEIVTADAKGTCSTRRPNSRKRASLFVESYACDTAFEINLSEHAAPASGLPTIHPELPQRCTAGL